MEDFKNAKEIVCRECRYYNDVTCDDACPVFRTLHKKQVEKEKNYRRENLLIENACCIMGMYLELACHGDIDTDKIENIDTLSQYKFFADWAREFEDDRVGEDNEDYLSTIENFSTEKILNEWGKDDE